MFLVHFSEVPILFTSEFHSLPFPRFYIFFYKSSSLSISSVLSTLDLCCWFAANAFLTSLMGTLRFNFHLSPRQTANFLVQRNAICFPLCVPLPASCCFFIAVRPPCTLLGTTKKVFQQFVRLHYRIFPRYKYFAFELQDDLVFIPWCRTFVFPCLFSHLFFV